MEEDHKRGIEKILTQIECRTGFTRYRPELKNSCKAKDIGLDSFLECDEKNPEECKFALPFGDSYLCRCPLGLYIAKKLKK